MTKRTRAIHWRRLFAASLLTACGVAGCDRGPTAPSQPELRTRPTAPAQPEVRNPAPTILSVAPSIGSIAGGAHIEITGAGLLPGTRVAFGATNVAAFFDKYSSAIFVTAPSHTPGSVDVVVTNVDGQNAVAIGAYTFAAPESFDVNGDWPGVSFVGDHDEPFKFTVLNGAVVDFTCSTSGLVRLSPPAPIIHGEFSFGERMVSPSPAGSWHRTKRWESSTSAQSATSAHASERNGTPPRNRRGHQCASDSRYPSASVPGVAGSLFAKSVFPGRILR